MCLRSTSDLFDPPDTILMDFLTFLGKVILNIINLFAWTHVLLVFSHFPCRSFTCITFYLSNIRICLWFPFTQVFRENCVRFNRWICGVLDVSIYLFMPQVFKLNGIEPIPCENIFTRFSCEMKVWLNYMPMLTL